VKTLLFSITINLIFTFGIFAEDFGELYWGMSQQEVIPIKGQPDKETENKVVFGTLTQTLSYKGKDEKITYELLFQENLLTNVSYTISTDQKIPANDITEKFREVRNGLDEIYEDPPSVNKIDNSTKKIVYKDGKTKVTIIYFNIPIKGDYVNRTAYLKVTYSNDDIILKAELNNRRIDRKRGLK